MRLPATFHRVDSARLTEVRTCQVVASVELTTDLTSHDVDRVPATRAATFHVELIERVTACLTFQLVARLRVTLLSTVHDVASAPETLAWTCQDVEKVRLT